MMHPPLDPIADQAQRDWHDPEGMAIHAATQAIYDLFEVLSVESAHWLATVAIINAERHARSRHEHR